MAGSENPDQAEGSAEQPIQAQPLKVKAKTFSCPKCGGTVTVRYPGLALSAACDFCHSVVDVTNENFRIISTASERLKTQPRIPLGTRGELFGKKWEVIGFCTRMDVSSSYMWEEYLLFNPYYGYRFLMYDSGHWNFVRMLKERTEGFSTSTASRGFVASKVFFDDKNYQVFYRGDAEVCYVMGEFYWRMVVGERVVMCDFICPPEMLSCENDEKGMTWSLSTYFDRKQIHKAFPMVQDEPPSTMAPNQLTLSSASWKTIRNYWMALCFLLTCLQIWGVSSSLNQNVLVHQVAYQANQKTSDVTTPIFVLFKEKGNVRVDLQSDVDNSWVWASGEIVNNDTGASYPFERTIEFYHGTDSDGYWSEGAQSTKFLISAMPAGRYYMNLDLESGDFKDTLAHSFTVSVTSGTPLYANYFWCLFLLSCMPCLVWYGAYADENARWLNSDFTRQM